jgi:adenosylcobinamide-phosphate synthase
MTSFELLGAAVLDLVLGDPRHWPHPVRWIGFVITKAEKVLRPRSRVAWLERAGGVVLGAGLPAAVYFLTDGIIRFSGIGGGLLRFPAVLYLSYTTLAMRSLGDAGLVVAVHLENADLPSARKALSEIVSRETGALSEEEVIRGTIESVAENSSDGVGAPLFYLVLGGAPLAMAYKTISTLDSMIGYRSDRYRFFGWASARLDDAANYIPARIAAFFISLSAVFMGGTPMAALKIVSRDGRKDDSPNSGMPEAAVAGALKIQLGGTSRYFSRTVEKPALGEPIEKLTVDHIRRAVRLTYIAMGLMLAVGIVVLAL